MSLLKKYEGVINSILIHYVLLIIVYAPLYFVFNVYWRHVDEAPFMLSNADWFGLIWYAASVGPYLILMYPACLEAHRFRS